MKPSQHLLRNVEQASAIQDQGEELHPEYRQKSDENLESQRRELALGLAKLFSNSNSGKAGD